MPGSRSSVRVRLARARWASDPGVMQLPTPQARDTAAFNLANRDCRASARWCPHCDKRYNLAPVNDTRGRSGDRVVQEQWRSGICSEECFLALNGEPMFVSDRDLDLPGRPAHEVCSRRHTPNSGDQTESLKWSHGTKRPRAHQAARLCFAHLAPNLLAQAAALSGASMEVLPWLKRCCCSHGPCFLPRAL
jgi:hypothetical protein